MVSDRDRAQLILIGAILIATIIFGLSVLLNSLVFTGASGASSAGASLDETDLADFEIQRNVRAVIVRVNHADRNVTFGPPGDLEIQISENVTRYSRLLAESKAASGSIAVDVSYNNSTSRSGYRIVQAHDDDFTDMDGNPSWVPVPGPGAPWSTPDTNVGWFTANVNVANTTGTPFRIFADNGSRELEIELTPTGPSNSNLSVETNLSPPGATATTACASARDRVLLDLYRGNGFVDGCEFVGIDNLTGAVSVEFENADQIQGKYEIVINRSNARMNHGSPTYQPCVDAVGTPLPAIEADPCVAPVIWSANLTTRIDGDGIDFENSYNLSLYADES